MEDTSSTPHCLRNLFLGHDAANMRLDTIADQHDPDFGRVRCTWIAGEGVYICLRPLLCRDRHHLGPSNVSPGNPQNISSGSGRGVLTFPAYSFPSIRTRLQQLPLHSNEGRRCPVLPPAHTIGESRRCAVATALRVCMPGLNSNDPQHVRGSLSIRSPS